MHATAKPSILCERLGIERPVLLAPMAKIAGARLAAAVSDAGGLGLLGGGYGDLEWIRREWRAAGGARIGVGLITWTIDVAALDAVLELRPAAVWLSFGDAAFGIGAVQSAGAVAIVQVASAAEAVAALDAEVDVLVGQGVESGGHGRPRSETLDLVRSLVALAGSTPVVAAGGITTRADFDRMIEAGASGVALGTALYATDEAADAGVVKNELVNASADQTVRSVVYDRLRGPDWPTGYDGRSLRNTITETWAGRETDMSTELDALRAEYAKSAAGNDMTKRVVWAGTGVGDITKIVSAASVLARFPSFRSTKGPETG